MIKVCKFGGSSVAGAEQFAKIKKIVESDFEIISKRYILLLR